jgi:heme exporter protein CcmD
MSHTPFIIGAYAISTLVMLWTALAPIVNKRGLLKQLKIRQSRMDRSQ